MSNMYIESQTRWDNFGIRRALYSTDPLGTVLLIPVTFKNFIIIEIFLKRFFHLFLQKQMFYLSG